MFLIYINDLPNGLKSIAKLFADDTSVFSTVGDPNELGKYLNLDHSVISQWSHHRKMLFKPDPKNPAYEVIFSRKKNEETHSIVFYNNIEVFRTDVRSTWV